MNGVLLIVDMIAAVVIIVHAYFNLHKMGRLTKHCYRIVSIVVAVSALAILLSPLVPDHARSDWWANSHVIALGAIALRMIIGRRPSDRMAACSVVAALSFALLLSGCAAAPDADRARYLSDADDARMRALCASEGCQIVPNSVWQQIDAVMKRLGIWSDL